MRAWQEVKTRLEGSWPSASLRTYLVAVMLLAILPIAAILSLQIFLSARSEQLQLEEELSRSAAALAQSVERELTSSLDALAVLSHSELFQQGRVSALGRLLQGRPRRDWDSVFLLDRDGTLMLDTAAAARAPLEPSAQMRELHRRVLQKAEPAVSDWDAGGAAKGIAIALPVVQGGAVRFVLGARMSDSVWQRLTASASTPAGGYASLFDSRHRLIGSSAYSAPAAGTALQVDAVESIGNRDSGVHRVDDVDGAAVYAAWQELKVAGWHADVLLPAAPIDAGHRRAIAAALFTSGGSLLLGLLLAATVARRIARPLRKLATEGPEGMAGGVPVHEIALLRDALLRARRHDDSVRALLEAKAREFESLFNSLAEADRQLRESQHLTELAQDAGRVGFFHYEFARDRMIWTAGHRKLFDAAALPDARLQDWLDRIAGGDRDRIEREFWTACAVRRDTDVFDYRVPSADGSVRWLSSRVLISYDAEGRATQLTGVTVDMTQQKQAELQNAELTERALVAQGEAEAASRAKDEFLTMLSHELRNPLGAISAAIDVLDAAEPGSANANEARAIIARQTRNLSHMMNDLLDVGRVIAGKVMLAHQPVNLAALVRRVEQTAALTGESRDHPLRLELEDAWVDGDAVRIEQVVTNLVTNAIKYTPAGREIGVALHVQHGVAVLDVRDAGMGIPPALLPHIFDLFVQGHRTLDRRAGGLGIGLTLVRRLVELHGGTVGVESSDEGSRFTVRLPAIAAPEQTKDGTLPPSRRRNVLVVEDNDDVLSALRSKLELDGHTVSTAADGIEGLTRLLKQRPEISIVDIGLPGLTGFELARHARAAGYAGRMIAMSGYGAERDAQEALVAGFDAYLVKPVDRNQLRASLSAD